MLSDKDLAAERSADRGFGYVNDTYINLYRDDNPILEEGDECWFLFNSADNYHIMCIGRGTVVRDWFTDGLNKLYCIRLDEVCETPAFCARYVWGREYFMVNRPDDKEKKIPRLYHITENTSEAFLAENFFKVECFFVRKTVEAVLKLRREYTITVYEDTRRMMAEMEEIITNE
jgi:hypothetical protein